MIGAADAPTGSGHPKPEHRLAIGVDELALAVKRARQDGYRFVDLFGVDTRGGLIQLHVLLSRDVSGEWLRFVVDFSAESLTFPSLVADVPAAGWYEREVWSELGLRPDGHPKLEELELLPAPDGVVDYPLGPIRSGVVESGHYLLRTVGEEIIDMALRLSYKHRGIEQRGASVGLQHLPLLAERISGTDAFAESLALCLSIERLAGVTAPPRAQVLRAIFAELERLYNHLGYHADLCQATGLVVGQAQFDILRERVLRLNARLAGHRYLFGLNVAGGLSLDLNDVAQRAVRAEVDAVRKSLDTLGRMALTSPSHLDRLEATGVLRPEDAEAYAAVGPIGRASGQDRDVRRDHPYVAYMDVEFTVPVYAAGDALARAHVRLDEAHQALRLITHLLDRIPAGPVRTPIEGLRPHASGLGWAESARGETVHWLQTDGVGQVRRYRVRTASLANWQAFPLAVPGHNILTDFPVIEQSFGLSYAGNDR
jgi:Ni,Fe-hydrogenase III large subunit